MTKHATFGKKPFSLKAEHDDTDTSDSSLDGQRIAALSSMASVPTLTVSAPTPSAITYPSSNVSKVYQHWADGDAAKGTTPEWNNNILSDSKSDYFEGEVVSVA